MRRAWVLVAVLVLGAWTCAPVDDGGSDVSMTTTGLNALSAGEPWHYVGATGEPAFQNSWANSPGMPALAFRIRETGIVDLQGVLVDGADSTTVFTLPEGYRPSQFVMVPAVSVTPSAAYFTIDTDGDVTCSYNGLSAAQKILYAQVFLDPPDLAS